MNTIKEMSIVNSEKYISILVVNHNGVSALGSLF